jgi:hypothetical protein
MAVVREVGGDARLVGLHGATLRQLATFAGADIDAEFSCGDDTPEIGDPDEPISLEPVHVAKLGDWYQLGWRILDSALASLPAAADPATLQLWPEHFDIGTNVNLGGDRRANLGCSPGDSFEPEPYLYVEPWGSERPGDPSYWNAPFGAVLRQSELARGTDLIAAGLAFIDAGLGTLYADVTMSSSSDGS